MSELAHRILSVGKAGYFTRLSISLAIVGASLMPVAIYFYPDSNVFVIHWAWASLLGTLPGLHFLVGIPPALFGVLTAAILAVAALRFRTSVLATVWFAMNALVVTAIWAYWAYELQQTRWYGK